VAQLADDTARCRLASSPRMAPPHLDPETPGSEASKPDSPDAEYRIGWTLRRLEWLATEWPAVVVWGGWAGFLLAPVTVAARQSWWWLVLLIVWWLVGGRKAVGLLVFLLRGGERNDLTISPDGTMFASTNQSEAVYAHWRAFVNQASRSCCGALMDDTASSFRRGCLLARTTRRLENVSGSI
jgi:hypothetical protein